MDITCLFAALLFFVGNVMDLIYHIREWKRPHFNREDWIALDVDYIQAEWEFRISHKALELSAGFINAFAWFIVCFPILQLVWILSHHGRTKIWWHVTIGILALGSSFTEWISRFLYIGSMMSAQLLYTDFDLSNWGENGSSSDIGWKTLELTFISQSGIILFVDAFEWIAMFFIFTLLYASVKRWRSTDTTQIFGGCWNSISLFIALMSLLEFIAEILRLDGLRPFGEISFYYSSINRLILIPLWLLGLGFALPHAAIKLNYETAGGGENNNMNGGGTRAPAVGGATTTNNVMDQEQALTGEGTSPPPTFTIGDNQDDPNL